MMADEEDGKLTKAQLKAEVRQIILAQGNDFIKELLRDNGLKIGTTKKDFAANLAEAIESEVLTQGMIETWLAEIEGWGDQHLYLLEAPRTGPDNIEAGLLASEHGALVGTGQSYLFPEDLTLTTISFNHDHLSLVWHLGKEGWDRARPKDFSRRKGLELYRYEAFRQRLDRSLVRFEWRFADGYCAILVHRNRNIDHAAAMAQVWMVLSSLGISERPLTRVPLNEAVKSASKGRSGTKSTRFETEGGFIDLVCTLADGGIESVEPVRQARLAVNDGAFAKAQGLFHLDVDTHALSRAVAVQVYGSEGRLRFWAQCRREDVYLVIEFLWRHNQVRNVG